MTLSLIFFILVGALSLAAAVGVVASHQPVHSALFLLANFATLAVLYITLEAQFLAAIQVIIYAGGIVILILFVIMLIGHNQEDDSTTPSPWAGYVGLVLGLLMLSSIALNLTGSFAESEANAAAVEGGVPKAVGMALFTEYILPFEQVAILLLVALIGALLLARRPGLKS